MNDVDENFLKSLCRSFFEMGADEEALKLFISDHLLNTPETETRTAYAHAPKTNIQRRADAIVKETWYVASTGSVTPGDHDLLTGEFNVVPQVTIKAPPKEYAWTKSLCGYEASRISAINGLHRLWASTRAAAAGFNSKTPHLDELLFLIRAGQIKRGDPRIQEGINFADKYGFSGNIRERIGEELHNAEKRVSRRYFGAEIWDSMFYDLNPFRTSLGLLWVGGLFWLMPDHLIAEFLSNKSNPTTRQAVSQAISDMGLTKHEPALVKSLGDNFQLRFVEGYPPKT